jgi:hypothetical protein
VGTGGPDACDVERGVCVDCTGPGQPCPFCELDTYSCVGCLVDADCPSDQPTCGPSYECSAVCESDEDCAADDLFCDPATQLCVECWKNAHCPGETCQRDFTCG